MRAIGATMFIVLMALSVLPVFSPDSSSAEPAESPWWDTSWPYRRRITISGAHPENFQIKVVIPPDIPKSVYPSIRFLENETGGLLPYWIERSENSYTNVAWVRRLENSDDSIYMYYGNPNATSAENGDNVFLFFTDFGNYRNEKGWSVLNTFGIVWKGDYVTLFDLGDARTKLEKKPPTDEASTERIIEFRVRARSVYRGGLLLSGPGSFGEKEYACVHSISGFRFFSDGEQSQPIALQGEWYIGQVSLYSNNRIRAAFLSCGENYRQILWSSTEKVNNWNPQTGGSSYCDKYSLAVWDGGGTSSYDFDWFIVRRYSGTEPQTSAGPEERWWGPPPSATLRSPADGATTIPAPRFEWMPSPLSTQQVFEISDGGDFTRTLLSVSLEGNQASYQSLLALEDGEYYWRVISANENGSTPSEVRKFRVDSRPKPSGFSLLAPWDGRTTSDRSPKLVWENSEEPAMGISHYEVWIDGVNVENVPAGVTEYVPPPLSLGPHSWRIVAVGRSGAATSSPTFTFEITEVGVVSQDENGFVFRTGEYLLSYSRAQGFISIYPENAAPSRTLRLVPGGGDSNLQVLNPGNISEVAVENRPDALVGKIKGSLSWARYELQLILPKDLPRAVSYRLYVTPTRALRSSEGFFTEVRPEFRYADNAGASFDPNLIDYLDGLPNAWSGGLHDEYCRDLNQFIFFGDPTVLKSTFLYYCDFTSLNRFFEYSGNFFTRIDGYTHHSDDVVRQPPGFFRTQKTLPITFGYDVPANRGILPENVELLISNGIFSLFPSCPNIYDTVSYMKIFIKSLYPIYQLVEKPPTRYTYWPGVVENSIRDLKEQDAELAKIGRRGGLHPYAITSYSMFAERFGSENAAEFVENAERMIAGSYNPNYTNAKGSRGILGRGGRVEPVHFLFNYCDWALYAEHFNSENIKAMLADTADVIMDLARGVGYIFTFYVDVDRSAPVEDGGYQFEAAGEYAFFMLSCYQFTGNAEFLSEAERAAEAILHMGFEYSYEFFATPIAPLAMLRLYKITGNPRYLEGSYIPLATILRDSWLFNPDFPWGVQDYKNRTIFFLTSARPNLSYANGWEEQALIQYLYLYLKEGRDVLMPEAAQLTSELLRYKGTSARDSLAPYQENKSNLYVGIPREWSLPLNPNWFIPLEGFGISRMDEKLGAISQPPYCSGMLPQLALIQFYPVNSNVLLYTDAPADAVENGGRLIFRLLAKEGSYLCGLSGQPSNLLVTTSSGERAQLTYDENSDLYVFYADAGKTYTIAPKPFSIYPENGSVVAESRPTFGWEMPFENARARFLLALDPRFENVLFDIALPAGENSWTPADPIPDGSYWWKVILSGDFGELISDVHSITIDTAPPLVLLTQKPPDLTYENLLTYAGEATDQASYVVAVEYRVDNGEWLSAENVLPLQHVFFHFSVEVQLGGHRVEVRARDAAGNISQPLLHLVEVREVPVAIFVVENLRLSKENARPGENVTVWVDVANVGGAAGEHVLSLKVDGLPRESRTVMLAAGQRETVSFQISISEVGIHVISVDSISKELRIAEEEKESPLMLIVGIFCGIALLLALLKLVVFRR